jgi:hypothetical protein
LITPDNDLYSIMDRKSGGEVKVKVNREIGATMEVADGAYELIVSRIVDSVRITSPLPSQLSLKPLLSYAGSGDVTRVFLTHRPSDERMILSSQTAPAWTSQLEIKSEQDNRWQLSIPDWAVEQLRALQDSGAPEPQARDESNAEASK